MNSNGRSGIVPRALPFTLIELLIVVAIIGILAALLLPSLQKSRELAKSIVCMNSMKQNALAMFSYAGDNKGLIGIDLYDAVKAPSTIKWINFLMGSPSLDTSYMKKDTRVYCPSGPVPNLASYDSFIYGTLEEPPTALRQYVFRPMDFSSGVGFLKLANAGSKYPLLIDSLGYSATLGWQQSYFVDARFWSVGISCVHLRHSNGANVIFSDGHTQRMGGKELRSTLGFYNGYTVAKEEISF